MGSNRLPVLCSSLPGTMDTPSSPSTDQDIFNDLRSLESFLDESRSDSAVSVWDTVAILCLSLAILCVILAYLHRRKKDRYEGKLMETEMKDIVWIIESGLGDRHGLSNQNYEGFLDPDTSSTCASSSSASSSPDSSPPASPSASPTTSRSCTPYSPERD